jgi:predicted nucleic acid-binding protein
MNNLFIDSDILIDLLAKRAHYYEALRLLSIVAEGKAKAFTTSLVIANVNYIITKFSNRQKSIKSIRTLRKNISILTMNENIIDEALVSSFPDFEDSLQYFSALNQEVDFIVTRNKKDYSKGTIKVVTAGEYLDFHSANLHPKGV